jgi:hypothetical protein
MQKWKKKFGENWKKICSFFSLRLLVEKPSGLHHKAFTALINALP